MDSMIGDVFEEVIEGLVIIWIDQHVNTFIGYSGDLSGEISAVWRMPDFRAK